jgi:hypothetical protein
VATLSRQQGGETAASASESQAKDVARQIRLLLDLVEER